MLKVLIIDDDEIVLLVESKILQRCGISDSPLSFRNGKAAIDYLQFDDNADNYIILLDINMPGMNGWEFLEKLKVLNLSKRFFVIMVTSSIDRYDKEVAVKYQDVISFIEKPITARNCQEIKSLPEISHFFEIS